MENEDIFRVIVAGSRSFNDYALMKRSLDRIFSNIKTPIEIVSGTAGGADKLGERYADENGYLVKIFVPEWTKHQRKAGPIRNEEMAKYVAPDGGCIVFIVNDSSGSKHMIKMGRKYKLKLRIIRYGIDDSKG